MKCHQVEWNLDIMWPFQLVIIQYNLFAQIMLLRCLWTFLCHKAVLQGLVNGLNMTCKAYLLVQGLWKSILCWLLQMALLPICATTHFHRLALCYGSSDSQVIWEIGSRIMYNMILAQTYGARSKIASACRAARSKPSKVIVEKLLEWTSLMKRIAGKSSVQVYLRKRRLTPRLLVW